MILLLKNGIAHNVQDSVRYNINKNSKYVAISFSIKF